MAAFRYTVDSEGIARVVMDLPGEKVNTLSVPVLQELEGIVDAAAQDKKIKALAISSGKEDTFIAGADLHSFEPIFQDPSSANEMLLTGHRVFDKLARLPFPTIALINGTCLGGGTELALSCTYRLASDNSKTVIGLPEVTLGIFPGWGGTQRLPRLIGLMEGLPFILGGKPVKANKAFKMKLVDALAATEFFEKRANEFIRYCLSPEGKKQIAERRKLHGLSHALLENNFIGRALIYRKAEKDILKRTKGHYPAPLLALQVIKDTYTLPLQQGLRKEIDVFQKNLKTGFSNSRNLIALFFIQEALKKDPGVEGDIKPLKVNAAGVIGAGTMGSLIAWMFSFKDIPVRMKDIDWNALGKGFGNAFGVYKKLIKDRKLKPSEASLKFHGLSGTVDYSGFKNLDLIIEAAVENLELKHKILKELEQAVRDDAIIASNTSSLTIAEMGAVMAHPERFVGMHFFNPADRMPLVEVVASDKTSPKAVATAVEVCRKLGKTPIVVRDCPGFLVNRIFVPGANEILRMYQEGADWDRLEKMMLDFGMPMSPFVLADEVGNDVSYKVSKVFEKAYGPRMAPPALSAAMFENQLFGKKNGQGFFLYDGDKRKPNPKAIQLRNELLKSNPHQKPFVVEDMRDRPFLIMINEAARCLEEQIVANPGYLDMALIMGIGFPPFRGGLLRYADSLGIDYIVNHLKRFAGQYGERFAPCKLLLDMQKKHTTFFSGEPLPGRAQQNAYALASR